LSLLDWSCSTSHAAPLILKKMCRIKRAPPGDAMHRRLPPPEV